MSETVRGQSAQTTAPSSHKGHPTLFILFVGIGMLILWAVAFITQIQTNEAFIQHGGHVTIFQPDWSILVQIPELLIPGMRPEGPFSSEEAIAIIIGWGIELVYLGFVVGYELLHDSVHKASG